MHWYGKIDVGADGTLQGIPQVEKMSLELHPNAASAAETLFKTWESGTDVELEATFKTLDLSQWLQVVQHLRSLGLREESQPAKLNIMVAGGLRFTLVGEGIIQEFCKDNVLLGKPFHVVLKGKQGAGANTEVDWDEYGVRVKLRRELPLSMDDVRVRDALSRWASLPKSFRYIKRYSFSSLQHKGLIFDLSVVRQNKKSPRGDFIPAASFTAAEIAKQPMYYEAEVEATTGATFKSLLVGIATVLRGIQRSFVLVRNTTKKNVLEYIAALTGADVGVFPGPQPATLERANVLPDQGEEVPNLRAGDYNVTDKADGQRCLLLVAKSGALFLVDTNMNVYGTDLRLQKEVAAEWAGTLLDGEWVRQDAKKEAVSRFYAFDIYNGRKGEDVASRPFLIRGETNVVSRHQALSEAIGVLANAQRTVVAPKSQALSLFMKTFLTPMDRTDVNGIFHEAASILDRLKVDPPYHSDGLIFTPNNAGLPKLQSSWPAQFKWKPASENTIDFLVMVEKDKETGADLVNVRTQEDANQIVRYKTLRLFVGSNTHPALANPRDAILQKKPLPESLQRGEYRPVEFAPQPADPMASVCYMALNAGATNPAGASDAIVLDEVLRCPTGDPIESRTIVEMSYHPERPAGWRWEPMRVRWDKTERIQRGILARTMNADWVAQSIWSSIHNPVSEHMIRTGSLEESTAEATSAVVGPVGPASYYVRKAPARDLHRVRNLRSFHNEYIKSNILLGHSLRPGAAVYDMTVGMAGDIHKWIAAKVEWVLGTDIAEKNLADPAVGAYRRYVDQTVLQNGKIPAMLFVQADASQRLADGGAGQSPMDRSMLRCLWGSEEAGVPPYAAAFKGKAADGFDVVSCMFSLHYFFKDRPTVDGWLRNVSETLRVGGLFVGCCFDGDSVQKLLQNTPVGGIVRGQEDGVDVWSIVKRYESEALPATDESLGKPIDVSFISIGEAYTEYLVSWEYLKGRMEAIGCELLNAEELAAMGLQHSTALFSESYQMAARSGRNFPMSPKLRDFSFLNRWFIFKRRSTGAEIPYMAPGITSALSEKAREDAMGPVGPTGEAPVPNVIPVEDQLPQMNTDLVEVDMEDLPHMEIAEEEEEIEEPVGTTEKPKVEEEEPEEEPEEAEEEPEEAEEDEEEEESVKATGPIYKFYQKSELKDDLEIGDKGWRRWLATYAPFPLKDRDSNTLYPSLEAALAAEKFKVASNKPELGPTLFGETGAIHQQYATLRAQKGALKEKEEYAMQEDEGDEVRKAAKATEMKKIGAKFDAKKWESELPAILDAYIGQRYQLDARFRSILDAVKAKKAHLVFFTTAKSSGEPLSGYINEEDEIMGDNLYGKALMRAVGLYY